MILLYERSKKLSRSNFRKNHGIWPPKLLCERSKEVICVRLGRSVGYDPVKLHLLRYNFLKDFNLMIRLGKSIGNLVLERPKALRGLLQLCYGREPIRLWL